MGLIIGGIFVYLLDKQTDRQVEAKLLIIENDGGVPDRFEELIKKIATEKNIKHLIYAVNAKNHPERAVAELLKGVDYIAIAPHVVIAQQWSFFLNILPSIKRLKEIHIQYAFDFEKELNRELDVIDISNIELLKKNGVGLYLSDLTLPHKTLKSREVNIERIKNKYAFI